jgi:succinate dehydrogenase/fumarate reductase flavoprotein subunit
MRESSIRCGAYTLPVFSLNTVVVGTGAAGYNAAERLHRGGQPDVAIVTEHILAGTSRNTGSDKQTYYKLTLSGGEADSVREMAETLFSGQCVDGDIALCEAALSAQCFLRLAELGVPFPRNRYGEYVGYKTDHDPRRRATSVGPYTSRRMTECLEAAAQKRGIRVFDKMQAVMVLGDGGRVYGLLCLDLTRAQETADAFTLFVCTNIIYATGGPAGMYANSVYPNGHFGATGIALEAGVMGRNLTEWQFGLASLHPRWNVSGTYMQALPHVYSTDAAGGDERSFLCDFFADRGEMLTKMFLKGYQWPFDVRKAAGGSSLIDLLVVQESAKGRRVFLDYRRNPCAGEVNFESLAPEAHAYLQNAGACFGLPIDRLLHMNKPAVDFYRDKGVDLAAQPLEVALCAQHNNGGLAVDCWWQTNLQGFFAVGEVAASHGVYRPGGSALNAGQVGGARAAQFIAARGDCDPPAPEALPQAVRARLDAFVQGAASLVGERDNTRAAWHEATRRMSRVGGAIRSEAGIAEGLNATRAALAAFWRDIRVDSPARLGEALRLRDTLLSQETYLAAMADYLAQGGKSRGSALYTDPMGCKPHETLPDLYAFTVDDGVRGGLTQEVTRHGENITVTWRPVRPIPVDDDFFENVWRAYRENGNVY